MTLVAVSKTVEAALIRQAIEAGVRVLLVYPGPGEKLDERAKEFLTDKQLPENFDLVLDPDYAFTNSYGLRWDAPKETAYPSTFLLDQQGKVFFAKVSKSHGGRTNAASRRQFPRG